MANASTSNTPTPWTGKQGSRLAVPLHDPEIGPDQPDSRRVVVVKRVYFK